MSTEKGRDDAENERVEGTEERSRAARPGAGEDRNRIEQLADQAWILLVLMVPGAMVVGFIQGAGAAILVLIAAALISVIALFWSSVRTLLGETPLSGADAFAIAAPRAEEEQKQAILRALKDLEFERSVGKISEADYVALVTKYRAEAKRLLRVIEEDSKPRRDRVEELVRNRLIEAGLAPAEQAVMVQEYPPQAEEKKKKKKKKGEPVRPEPSEESEEAEGRDEEPQEPERRVEIESIEPAEKSAEPEKPRASEKPKSKKKAPIDITWKSPLPSQTKGSQAIAPATKTCSECATANDPDANFCKKCGSKSFEAATSDEGSAQ